MGNCPCFSKSRADEETQQSSLRRSGGNEKPVKLPTSSGSKTMVADKIKKANALGVLSLREMKLKSLPNDCFSLTNLRTFDAAHNQLRSVPPAIGNLQNIKTLGLEHNNLESVPAELSQLRNLKTLLLHNNKLPTLPDELGMLPSLTTLNLSHNIIVTMPSCLAELCSRSLASLNVSWNAVSTLEDSFFAFATSLEELIFNSNKLEALPSESISKAVKLRSVELEENALRALPVTWLRDSGIEKLELKGNPIKLEALKETEGFDAFLERRKARKDKQIKGGVIPSLGLCGLDEE